MVIKRVWSDYLYVLVHSGRDGMPEDLRDRRLQGRGRPSAGDDPHRPVAEAGVLRARRCIGCFRNRLLQPRAERLGAVRRALASFHAMGADAVQFAQSQAI